MLRSLLKQLAAKRSVTNARAAGRATVRDMTARATALLAARDHEGLLAHCRAHLAAYPDDPDALIFLASALGGLGNVAGAIRALQRALATSPQSDATHVALARLLLRAGRVDEAIEAYRNALARTRTEGISAELSALLNRLGRYDEAERCLLDAPRSKPVRRELARALFEQGRVTEAIAELRCLVEAPEPDPATHSELLRAINYSDAISKEEIFHEHVAWARRYADRLAPVLDEHTNSRDPRRALRVGLVSPHFRQHPVTFFLESVLREMDRDSFAVTLYSDATQLDTYSERLRALCTAWRNTAALSDESMAGCVRGDAIDILIDLSGHTAGNRLLMFARRPAPLQITWNGYPNTTGVGTLDYRITDASCDPPGTTEHLHTERLLRLPQVYMSWCPPHDAPSSAQAPHVRNGYVTFASFNACYKLSATTLGMWCRILQRVPDSRLLLAAVPAGVAERRLQAAFEQAGIERARLLFRPRISHEAFLALHEAADIALDPYPYHGTTTTCFSLWMGVPVVSLAGETHVARVGVSLLTNVGLTELVANSRDEYVRIACELAADRARLNELRRSLRTRLQASPLTDGKGCATALQAAMRRAWIEWCSRAPRSAATQAGSR